MARDGIPEGEGQVPAYEIETEKTLECTRCKRFGRTYKKPVSEFNKCQNRARGYKNICKICQKEQRIDGQAKKKAAANSVQQPIDKPQAEEKSTKTEKSIPRSRKPKKVIFKKKLTPKIRTFRGQKLEDITVLLGMDQPIGSDARELHFWLNAIINDQLHLFHESRFVTQPARVRARKLIDTTLFAITKELSRLVRNMESIKKDENYRADVSIYPNAAAKLKAYIFFGLKPGASKEAIKAAYRREALEAHPDRGGTTESMQRLNDAYNTLMEKENGRDLQTRDARECREPDQTSKEAKEANEGDPQFEGSEATADLGGTRGQAPDPGIRTKREFRTGTDC